MENITAQAPKSDNNSSFIDLMKANPRQVENHTQRPKPSTSDLWAAKQEAEATFAEAREKKSKLTAKLSGLVKEINAARETIAQAASTQQTAIELAAIGQATPADLERAKKAVADARAAESNLRAVHDATEKALAAVMEGYDRLKAYAKAREQRYWKAVCDELTDELKAIAGDKILRLYAAHSAFGSLMLSDVLSNAFPQPKGEDLKKTLRMLEVEHNTKFAEGGVKNGR